MKGFLFNVLCPIFLFEVIVALVNNNSPLNEVSEYGFKEKKLCSGRHGITSHKYVPFKQKCGCKRVGNSISCTECKQDFYYQNDEPVSNCVPCFCSGVTNVCKSSDWSRDNLSLDISNGTEGIQLVFRNLNPVPLPVELGVGNNEVFVDNLESTNRTYYWKLPALFEGDKLTSYGGQVRFTSNYEIHNKIMEEKWLKSPMVIMKGNGIKIYARFRKRQWQSPNQGVQIVEEQWYKKRKHLISWSTENSKYESRKKRQRKKWKRRRRRHVKRNDIMRLLTSVDYVLLKANSQTNVKRVSLSSIFLSHAVPKGSNSSALATSVENCNCPEGYGGLSCQYCLSGYTENRSISQKKRSSSKCIPCQCHGHSKTCHHVSGECSDCEHNTAGKHCQYSTVECDPRGTYAIESKPGTESHCKCKARVQGNLCGACKSGYYNLALKNDRGCTKCWCSGVTFSCSSSKLRRFKLTIQPPTFINIGFSDGSRQDFWAIKVNNGRAIFHFKRYQLYHSYHWSLPKIFTGNLLKSYGGALTFSMYSIGSCQENITINPLVKLESFDGRIVKWKYGPKIVMDKLVKFKIKLIEEHFMYYNMKTDRNTFLQILSSLKFLRVFVPSCFGIKSTEISNIVLDTAVTWNTDSSQAVEVEDCDCPSGYSGISCETCSLGYRKDLAGRRCVKKGF